MCREYVIVVVTTLVLVVVPALRAESPSVMLEKGIYAEETAGKLNEAIQIYQRIIDTEKAERPYVAQAMYRLGECYLKQGKATEAFAAFEAVIKRYPGQKEVVAKAEKRLASARQNLSEAQVSQIVKDAVTDISTRAETDPQVGKSLASLRGLNEAAVVKGLAKYLDSKEDTVRRSAIFILWKGDFDSVEPAVDELKKLCSHSEEFTRGMAALALGERKVGSSFQTLCDMTTSDRSGYARRCAAYALGLLGKADARPVLEKAKSDADPMVKNNAEAALKMLSTRGRTVAAALKVQQRHVGKPLSAFPEKVDLSSPESAWAAYQRASARMDAKTVVDLSWVKIDPKELDRSWKQAPKDDIEPYNKAQLDSTLEEVMTYGDDLAAVVSCLKFAEGVGRHPYSLRSFGRIDGKWKNLGEDRCPNVQAAVDAFKQKKDNIREAFEEMRDAIAGSAQSADARKIASDFLAAAASGDRVVAGRLTDPASAVAHQLRDFVKLKGLDQVRIESVRSDDEAAIAVTSPVGDDRDRKGPLVIRLVRQRGLWVVNDIDLASPEKTKAKVAAFLEQHPAAKEVTSHGRQPSQADKREAEQLAAKAWKLWQQRNLEEAEDLFEKAVAKDPANANAWNGLGWSQFNQGKALNAQASFEKCLAVEPKHAAALNGLGWIAKNAGRTAEAIGYWEKAVDAAPAATAAINGLATTYMEEKKYDQAAKYYRMWLKAEPDNADAKKGLDEATAKKGGSF